MTNTDHKAKTMADVPERAKASLAGAKVGLIETPIHLYEIAVSNSEETHLVGVPTLITAPEASFRVGKMEIPGSGCASPAQLERNISEALSRQGLSEDILTLLEQIIDIRVAQQVGLLVDVAKRAKVEGPQASSSRVDPSIMLTASEFGLRLGELSDETVRQREKAGQLFSVLVEGRKRGRKYPEFQLHPDIAGEPLQALLKALGDVGGALIYQFMTSPNDALGGLSPLQLLIKEPGGDEMAASLLTLPDAERLDAVLDCAADFRAEVTA
jgi:hypothetical protein